MSNGKLCGSKLSISSNLNSTNTINISCELYEGHDGLHKKMFYHCKKRGNITDNYRLGNIEWSDKLSAPESLTTVEPTDKQP